MSMMCSRCGRNIPVGTTFCRFCGSKVTAGNWRTEQKPLSVCQSGNQLKRVLFGVAIIAIVLVIVVMSSILFSGSSKLSGTWKGGKDGGETITFDDNGNFVTGGYKNDNTGTYEVDGNELTFWYSDGKSHTYSFELTDISLTLMSENGYREIYEKH